MSLKAKIEAVIYASEEPVTLAQLIGLLGDEAQLELDALNARQQSLALEDESAPGAALPEPVEDADALNAEILDDSSQTLSSQPESAALADEVERPAGEPATDLDGVPAADPKLTARLLRDYFKQIVAQLIADYATADRGLEVREVAGGFRLATKPEYHDAVRGFVKSVKPPLKLSLQALETLAVIAYKQPVTAPEISEIRGVDSAGVLGSLMTRKLITTAGRKQVIGRPILYKTTKDFLVRFGLKDINELPSIEEFEKMAGELNEAIQGEMPMAEHPQDTPHSAPIAETDSAPEPTHVLHDTPEDLMADDYVAPEGSQHQHPAPSEVEPLADVHSAQTDGDPGDDA
jgi:segregation and condensation protein B